MKASFALSHKLGGPLKASRSLNSNVIFNKLNFVLDGWSASFLIIQDAAVLSTFCVQFSSRKSKRRGDLTSYRRNDMVLYLHLA